MRRLKPPGVEFRILFCIWRAVRVISFILQSSGEYTIIALSLNAQNAPFIHSEDFYIRHKYNVFRHLKLEIAQNAQFIHSEDSYIRHKYNVFRHLKLEIASAIPASNDEK